MTFLYNLVSLEIGDDDIFAINAGKGPGDKLSHAILVIKSKSKEEEEPQEMKLYR